MEGKKRLATLVGCNYANTRNELHGCINDVNAMRDLLIARFGFQTDNITLLTDGPGSTELPTGAHIMRALGRMVGQAESGDVLFFHYSGHGTLIPAVKPHHGRSTRSSREEAIVPCDFNLITDVDFRRLVDRLPDGVSFTIISDSCHSGGLIDKEKEQIGPSSTHYTTPRRKRIIPYETVFNHVSSLSNIDSPHVGDHLLDLFGDEASAKFSDGLISTPPSVSADAGILLSGCQTNETSADMSPAEGNGTSYGAFSNAIQLVMKKHVGALSNREVVMRTRELLHKRGFSQHPCLYCSDDNADVAFLLQPVKQ